MYSFWEYSYRKRSKRGNNVSFTLKLSTYFFFSGLGVIYLSSIKERTFGTTAEVNWSEVFDRVSLLY